MSDYTRIIVRLTGGDVALCGHLRGGTGWTSNSNSPVRRAQQCVTLRIPVPDSGGRSARGQRLTSPCRARATLHGKVTRFTGALDTTRTMQVEIDVPNETQTTAGTYANVARKLQNIQMR